MASRSPPPPPAHLDRIHLPTVAVAAGELMRLFALGRDPLYFRVAAGGQKGYRFDAPAGEFGVMYAAFSLEVCFAETVLRTRSYRAPADQPTFIDETELSSRGIARLAGTSAKKLVLADLTGSSLARLHCDGSISTTPRYAVARAWSAAIWRHPDQVDGIRYVSRFLNSQLSVALFGRCAKRVKVRDTLPLIEHPQLPRLLDLFNVGI